MDKTSKVGCGEDLDHRQSLFKEKILQASWIEGKETSMGRRAVHEIWRGISSKYNPIIATTTSCHLRAAHIREFANRRGATLSNT